MNNKKSTEIIKQLQIIIREFKDEENKIKLSKIKDHVTNLETEINILENNNNSIKIQNHNNIMDQSENKCFKYISNLVNKIKNLLSPYI